PAGALRAAARARRASGAGRLESGARRRARDAGRLCARARRGTARCAARLAPSRRRRGAGGERAGRHLRQPRGLPHQRSAQRLVGLAFAERSPERVARLIVIGAPDRSHPLAIAWRSIQRLIVSLAAACGQAQEGLKVARALAMTTYRSAAELAARFGGTASRDGQRFVFPVEEYLFARGCDYATRHRAESFHTLSESIDLHRVDASRVFVPTTVVAVREDQLVPLEDLRALAARLPHGRLHEISSIYGHDAFLKESYQLRGIFRAALG